MKPSRGVASVPVEFQTQTESRSSKQKKEKQSKHSPKTILNSHWEHLNPCLGIPVEKKLSILKSGYIIHELSNKSKNDPVYGWDNLINESSR